MMPLSGNSQSQETPADPDLEVFPALALLLLLFAGSAALRIWLNPLIRCPSIFGDEWSYLELARSFARGAGPRMQAMPFNFRSYLYSVVIAPIAGHFEIEQAIEWICALNALMMSGTIFIAYAFTREIASRRSALVAAFFVALIPGFGLTGTIMTENLFMPASLLALWLSYRAVNHPAALRQIAAGFSLGLLYYIKPHGLIYPVIFFLIAVGTETFNAREHSAAGWPWKRYFFSISRYAWTGLSCLAVLAAQFPIIHYLFHEEDYLTLQSFLGSYYSRAVGERPFLWRDFGWVLFGNAATMIIATGFFPAIHFARTLWAAARGALEARVRNLALTAAAAVVVFWILTSRHTVVADPVPRLHERYMMIMDPLIWVLFAGSVGAAPGRLRGQAAGALGVAAISAINIFYAFNLRWFLLSDSPSLCGFLLAFIPSIAPVWMLPAYILVSALSLVFLLVSIWVRPLRVPAIIALLINLNGSYYAAHYFGGIAWSGSDRRIAQSIAHNLPRNHKLLVLGDGLRTQIHWNAGFFNEGQSLHLLRNDENWWSLPMRCDEDDSIISPFNREKSWLLAGAAWKFDRPPVKFYGPCALYFLGGSQPLRFDHHQFSSHILNTDPVKPPPETYIPEGMKVTFLSKNLPPSWELGKTSHATLTLRNDGPVPFPVGGVRLAMGYHWTDPERTGNWVPVVLDDGRYALIPEDVPPGSSTLVEMDIKAPDEHPGDRWALAFEPLVLTPNQKIWKHELGVEVVWTRVVPPASSN